MVSLGSTSRVMVFPVSVLTKICMFGVRTGAVVEKKKEMCANENECKEAMFLYDVEVDNESVSRDFAREKMKRNTHAVRMRQ